MARKPVAPNSGSSASRAVAGAIRIIAKGLLARDRQFCQAFTKGELAQAVRHLTGPHGIGRDLVTKLLDGIPGMNEATVKQQIVLLKASRRDC